MKVLIIYAHQEPKSFNGAMRDTAVDTFTQNSDEVIVCDLYAMNFNPVSDRHNFTSQKDPDYYKQQQEEMHATEVDGFAADIKAEMEKLEWCDVLIFQFPLWWFGLPAILKGWVDRVFAMGKIYGWGKWFDRGVFVGKRAMLSVTIGGSEAMYSETGFNGDINKILYPIHHGILRFVGFDVVPPFLVWSPARIERESRKKYLQEYKQRLLELPNITPIDYPHLDDFDDNFQLKQ